MKPVQPPTHQTQIVPLDRHHVAAVAHLHVTALQGDFLPSLGEAFLRNFYQSVLASGMGFGFVMPGTGGVEGFVLGSYDSNQMFRHVVLRSAFALGWAALSAVIRKPALIIKMLETFLYPSKEHVQGIKAELVVIAVQEMSRGQGVGRLLVAHLTDTFEQSGIQQFKVTVLKSNLGANNFYQSMDFVLRDEFVLYGREWNLYVRSMGGLAS